MKTKNGVKPVAEVFVAMSEVGWRVHEAPGKMLYKKVPDHRGGGNSWELVINGNAEPRKANRAIPRAEQWGELELPAFTAAVFWNGWLAGLINPYGGCLAAGSGANEDALIASIRRDGIPRA
jgi:hypothetical protein